MNRISRDSSYGNFPAGFQHRRGRSLTGVSRDENLDLFSANHHRSSFMTFPEESDSGLARLGRISVAAARVRSGIDDLLAENGGKHDYDWLLTPPGTPLSTSMDANECQPSLSGSQCATRVRSASTTKASRLSTTQSENNSSKPVRSSSTSRPSISAAYSNGHSYTANSHKNILNTSSCSITSRPTTPARIPARPSTPAAGFPSRTSTPAKSRPPSLTRPSTPSPRTALPSTSRPSTPTGRPQISSTKSANPTSPVTKFDHTPPSPAARPVSRPSTPTRRTPIPSPVPVPGRSSSVGRVPAGGRNQAPGSRGSSPGPRPRPAPQPLVLPDFPLDVPPNLRTTLPERSGSASRTRPGAALTVRGNSGPLEPVTSNPSRRASSPVVTRGRSPDVGSKGRIYGNGHEVSSLGNHKPAAVSDSTIRRPVKPATATESTGFGRTISKKSLDMALRHMDIRHSTGSIRGTSLFPQSIRSNAPKNRRASVSDSPGTITSSGSYSENDTDGKSPESVNNNLVGSLREPDLSASYRYDSILLKEDLKNTNWLHSLDDKSDQSPIFDHRFEPLPEPFGTL